MQLINLNTDHPVEIAGAGPAPTINAVPELGRGRSDPGLTTSTSGRNIQLQVVTAQPSTLPN